LNYINNCKEVLQQERYTLHIATEKEEKTPCILYQKKKQLHIRSTVFRTRPTYQQMNSSHASPLIPDGLGYPRDELLVSLTIKVAVLP